MHLAATDHHSALLTLYSLSRAFNNFSVSSLQYLCIGISRMGGPTTGDILYWVKRKNRVLRLHAYTKLSRCCLHEGTRNGDYRTVSSTVVRMPSLPPECLLVAAHASSLTPPMLYRSATSDASGQPNTIECTRIPSSVPATLCCFLPPLLREYPELQPKHVSPAIGAFGRVRVSSHSVRSVRSALFSRTRYDDAHEWVDR